MIVYPTESMQSGPRHDRYEWSEMGSPVNDRKQMGHWCYNPYKSKSYNPTYNWEGHVGAHFVGLVYLPTNRSHKNQPFM